MNTGAILGIGAAALFGIYADLAMNIASATNSSPQTTELFADDRADTLWKWVKIGGITAVGFGLVGTLLTGSFMPLIGTSAVIGVMFFMYRNALSSGQDAKDSTKNNIVNGPWVVNM
jgi:hypothetical protein